jgi:hypothetical protein
MLYIGQDGKVVEPNVRFMRYAAALILQYDQNYSSKIEFFQNVTRRNANVTGRNANVIGRNANVTGRNRNVSGRNANVSSRNPNVS